MKDILEHALLLFVAAIFTHVMAVSVRDTIQYIKWKRNG